jgi:uncharacterized membrane protein
MKPIVIVPNPFQLRMAILMGVSCALTLFLVEVRNLTFPRFNYFFLITNLVLAATPYFISLVLYHSAPLRKHLWLFIPALMAWLLAFPNAPYIITDLIHLKPRGGAPIWFDAILLFTAAFNGLMMGLLSLDMVQEMVSKRFKPLWGWVVAAGSLAAGSFGIYLGRFERYNSWNVITDPKPLAADILDRFVHPFDHQRTWAMTLVLTAVLTLFYLMFRFIRFRPEERVVGA